jgi:hypothetical protein
MTIYYLYIKTHNKTGLKYLGQTKKDPLAYSGSGTIWCKHLLDNGNDVDTTILLSTTCVKERNYWGRYYSTLFRITTAMDDYGNRIWANVIPETGGGGLQGAMNPMKRDLVRQKTSGDNHYTKREGYVETRGGESHHMKKDEHRNRMRGSNNPMSKPEVKSKHLENNRIAQNALETREKKRIAAKDRWADEEFKESTREKMRAGNTLEVRQRKSDALKGKPQKIITCPHCGKSGGNNIKRYHYDNCKLRQA